MTTFLEFAALLLLVVVCVAPTVKVRRDENRWDAGTRRFR